MLAFLALGCAPDPGDSAQLSNCDPADDATLDIGKGETGFTPLHDGGDEVELVHGPQGGFHVVMALEATHIDVSTAPTAHLRGYIDDELHAETYPYANFRCNEADDALQAWNLLLIWDLTPEELDGQEARVTAELTDAAGVTVSDEDTLVIHDPTLD